jgi:hypothetical protein
MQPDYQQRVREVRGPAGEAWLRRLPALLDAAAARWSLRLLPPFEPLSYHYVAPAVAADGREVVLKAGVPGRLPNREVAALRAFGGRGAVLLLHGDLHHTNILTADRAPWLAIDPQGVIGALLRNPFPAILSEPDVRSILARRADRLAADLGFDRQRVRGWAFAQAVLSAVWEVEDHGRDVQAWIAVAELLRSSDRSCRRTRIARRRSEGSARARLYFYCPWGQFHPPSVCAMMHAHEDTARRRCMAPGCRRP